MCVYNVHVHVIVNKRGKRGVRKIEGERRRGGEKEEERGKRREREVEGVYVGEIETAKCCVRVPIYVKQRNFPNNLNKFCLYHHWLTPTHSAMLTY